LRKENIGLRDMQSDPAALAELPAALAELAVDELRAPLSMRFAVYPSSSAYPSSTSRRRLLDGVRFVDQANGAELSEVILIESLDQEVSSRANAETLAIYGQRLAGTLADQLDRLGASEEVEFWQQESKNLASLLSSGIPTGEDPEVEFDEHCLKHVRGKRKTDAERCSPAESVSTMVQCGSSPASPSRKGVCGFVLCKFAELSDRNLNLIAEQQGLPLVEAVLLELRSPLDHRQTALSFLLRCVDPSGLHNGRIRSKVAAYAANAAEIIPAVVAAVDTNEITAVPVLSGLCQADAAALLRLKDLQPLPQLFAVLDRLLDRPELAGDAKRHCQLITLLGLMIDEGTAASILTAAAKCMRVFPSNTKIILSCSLVIKDCLPSVEPACLSHVNPTLEITGAMKLCKGVANMQKMGCCILRAMTRSAEWRLDGPGAEEVSNAVVTSVQKHGRLPGLKEDALAVLTGIANLSSDTRAIVANSMADISTAMSTAVKSDVGLAASLEDLRKLVTVEK